MTEIRNAIIESAEITTEDGYLTAWLRLDYGGEKQGFGGYNLGRLKRMQDSAQWTRCNVGGAWLKLCLDVAGVSKWSQLPGKAVRVRGTRAGVDAIGHIVKDKWFCPGELFAMLDEIDEAKGTDDAKPPEPPAMPVPPTTLADLLDILRDAEKSAKLSSHPGEVEAVCTRIAPVAFVQDFKIAPDKWDATMIVQKRGQSPGFNLDLYGRHELLTACTAVWKLARRGQDAEG